MNRMGNHVTTVEDQQWPRTFEAIRSAHDLAYCLIESAISLEEQEKPAEAIEKYKEGILQIDKALNVQVTCPENPDFNWERACLMIQKMKKTRAEVLTRINSIQSSSNFVPPQPPPSYDEAMATSSSTSSSSSSDGIPRTYRELATALENLQLDTKDVVARTTVLYTHENVRLYMISPTGQVLSTSEPETLTIAIVESDEDGTAPTAYLQIGSWVYPLVPGVSPCYRTNYGAFILPDVHSPVSGSSVGLILPEDADSDVYDLLESILHGIVNQTPSASLQQTIQEEREENAGAAISHKLVTGASLISRTLISGAEKAGNLINTNTPKLIDKITPASQAAYVNPKVAKGLKIAGSATSGAAQVTGFVANKVGCATSKLGKFLAPHIQKRGTQVLKTAFNMSEQEASSKVSAVLAVAAGAVEGFSTVYEGLEQSATILGQSLKQNTVKVVHHAYGEPASEATNDTLSAIGNVITVKSNLKIVTPKGLVKTTAKSTGKALAENYKSGGGGHQLNENVYHAMIEPVPRSTSNNSIGRDLTQPSTSGLKSDVVEKKG